MYRRCIKPLFDFIGALSALLVLSPLLVAMTIGLYCGNRGAVFFRQERPGKDGRIFRIIKFKTMTDGKDENGMLLPDEMRLTRTGRFLRATSLDELPQLINVLLGDMSMIGPRPLLPQYLSLYSAEQARRHEVKPGITGWAQCHGRNAISWSEKFKLDVWYVDHLSFSTDCRILFTTFRKVLARDGINQRGKATIEMFNGKN